MGSGWKHKPCDEFWSRVKNIQKQWNNEMFQMVVLTAAGVLLKYSVQEHYEHFFTSFQLCK